MKDALLLGLGRVLIPIPAMVWRNQVSQMGRHTEASLGFMSKDHRRVHYFVVRELPRLAEPLTPELIAQRLSLPVAHVSAILDELEKHMTFLFRKGQEAVVWAYPVTAEVTPHYLTFSTGEQLYAA